MAVFGNGFSWKPDFPRTEFLESETYFDNMFSFDRCGHCKKLAPEYEKLGATFKKAKSVLIAKVSALQLCK